MQYQIQIKQRAQPWTPLATTFPTKGQARDSKQYREAVESVLKGQLVFVRITPKVGRRAGEKNSE